MYISRDALNAKPEKPVKRGYRQPVVQRQFEAFLWRFHLLGNLSVGRFRRARGVTALDPRLQVIGKLVRYAVQIPFKAVDAAKALAVKQTIF